jgi:hypothetical protein
VNEREHREYIDSRGWTWDCYVDPPTGTWVGLCEAMHLGCEANDWETLAKDIEEMPGDVAAHMPGATRINVGDVLPCAFDDCGTPTPVREFLLGGGTVRVPICEAHEEVFRKEILPALLASSSFRQHTGGGFSNN